MGVPIDAKNFRRTLGQFATGVTVVTLWNGDELHGMTANAFSSVSLDPPLILVCVEKPNATHKLIEEVGRFAVNILSEDQEDLSRYFAGDKDPAISFEVEREVEATSPILKGTLGWLDCTVRHNYDGGDHTIYVGEVTALHHAGGRPLLFFGGKYGQMR